MNGLGLIGLAAVALGWWLDTRRARKADADA